jgi:hypothetical protein
MQVNTSLLSDHRQIYPASCIPMSVECVPKLLGIMEAKDFSLQNDLAKHGTSDWVKSFTYPATNPKVAFNREYLLSDMGFSPDMNRGMFFMQHYFVQLFNTIDNELDENRYVIISVSSGQNTWHMEVIYNKINNNLYDTLTFYYDNLTNPTFYQINLRQRITNMQGTDILTYKFI